MVIPHLNLHLGLGIFTFPISSLSSLSSTPAGTQRTEQLMLITPYQQVLSCMQGQHPLNLTAAPNRPATRKRSLFYRPLVTLLHANLNGLVHLTAEVLCSLLPTGLVWAHHQHKGAASSSFVLTSRLSSLGGRAMCLPNAPSLVIKLSCFTL